MMKRLFAAALLALASLQTPAFAQSVTPGLTPGCSSPPPAFGVVWTASQWIVCLSSLQPFLGYIPLNAGGGIMSGELGLSPSVTTNAPLNFQLGVAPTSPVNGDFWFTSAGPFYRAGGVTVGPLASTSSPTLASPTFTGTVTFPDASTATSAGFQNLLHLYVAQSTDAGGAQKLQVQGNAYVSGGLSIGTTTAASTGALIVGAMPAASVASSYQVGVTTDTATLQVRGHDASTNGLFSLSSTRSDGSNALTIMSTTSAGVTSFPQTSNFGTASTDYVQASGGGSGGAITTNGGTLTISSGAGTGTRLADSTIALTNAGYSNCAVLGTAIGGAITCGGAPSGYITYNDNVTADPGPAVTGNLYCMNTNAGALNLTLPASPGNGAYVAFSDCGGNFSVHNLTIVRNGSNIMFNAGDMVVSTIYAGGVLRYSTGQSSWILSPL